MMMMMMKTKFFAFLSFICVLAFSHAAEVTSNEVLFVDQKGNVSRPETLATTADMAANKAALITAKEKAAAAEAAARAGTNMVAGIIADIGRNELTIYRYGYTDGLSAAVAIDPDAKLLAHEFDPLNEINENGLAAFSLSYALKNSAPVDAQPIIRWSATVGVKNETSTRTRADYVALDPAQVEPVTRLDGEYVDSSGLVYPYTYGVKFYAPQDDKGFFLVDLTPDDAAGDGSAIDLPNGVKGGVTARVPFGNSVLVIEGGVVVGVE